MATTQDRYGVVSALEKTGGTGAGHTGIDVLFRNAQQVVEVQVKRPTKRLPPEIPQAAERTAQVCSWIRHADDRYWCTATYIYAV